jgi:hypothetical protein
MRRPVTWAPMCLALCLVMTGQRQALSADGADAYRLGPVAFARSGPDDFLVGLGAFDLKEQIRPIGGW